MKSVKTTENQKSRKIVTAYTEDTYRVKVYTYHDKNYKAYISIISECTIEESGQFTMESHRLYQDFSQRVGFVKTARYDFKKLQLAHSDVINSSGGIVGNLLKKNQEEKGQVA